MMNVYIFQAALLCEPCADKAKVANVPAENSDCYPQGPYSDSGGEADAPQHCDHCRVFLENPLTRDGVEYVAGNPSSEIVRQWIEFYDPDYPELTRSESHAD